MNNVEKAVYNRLLDEAGEKDIGEIVVDLINDPNPVFVNEENVRQCDFADVGTQLAWKLIREAAREPYPNLAEYAQKQIK